MTSLWRFEWQQMNLTEKKRPNSQIDTNKNWNKKKKKWHQYKDEREMVQSNQWIPPSPIKWHTLSREEQSRYYEMARQQRQLHMQLYPNWTMRDSVASGAARKRRNKRDKAADGGRNSINKPTQTNPHRNIESKYSQQQQTTTTTTLTPISIFLFCFEIEIFRIIWIARSGLVVHTTIARCRWGWLGGWERGAGRRFDRVVSSAVARCRQIRSNTTHAPTHFTSPPSRFRLPSVSFRFKIVRIDRISIYYSDKTNFLLVLWKWKSLEFGLRLAGSVYIDYDYYFA